MERKKKYAKPTLTVFGDIRGLTTGGGSVIPDAATGTKMSVGLR